MPPDVYIIEIAEDNFKELLISQQMSLKEIRIHDNLNFTDFIMKNLPNLERLTLSIELESINSINNEFLINDLNLRHLTFYYLWPEHFPILKNMLKHYKCIKYLWISSDLSACDDQPWMSSSEIHFENLTQLLLKSAWTFVILKAKMPNLKILSLISTYSDDEDDYDFTHMPDKNLRNVEKASLKFCKLESVLAIVQKCQKLSHLNVDIEDWNEKIHLFVSQVIEIIAAAPHLRCLGLCESNLKKQNITLEVLNQVVNKNVILKAHNEFPSMLYEDWEQDYSDSMECGDFW
jgi:hypothetical protein